MAEDILRHQLQTRVDRGMPRLLERDREIISAVAAARYLTTAQIHRLLFASRHESASRKRLAALAGLSERWSFTPPYLHRLTYRTHSSLVVVAWTLAEAGYAAVQQLLGRECRFAGRDVGPAFMEHAIAVSDLFVELAAPHLRGRRSVAELPFAWEPTDTVRLPWAKYDPQAGKHRDRVLVPDAVLALPTARRRIFVECEMGTHSIVAASDEKSGATLAKAERWDEFISGYADPARRVTFYTAAFPDGWVPEVLFLVQTPSRRDSVNQALERWRSGRGGSTPRIHARTQAEVVQDVSRDLSSPPSPSAPKPPGFGLLSVSADEATALRDFYQHALQALAPLGLSPELRQVATRARPVLVKLGIKLSGRTA